MEKGFIAIEGQDGSGKGTQAEWLDRRLQENGFFPRLIDLPQYGNSSAFFVEQYLKGSYGDPLKVDARQASVFFAVDRFAAGLDVRKWLKAGNIVIADRWTLSNLAHQAAKLPKKESPEFMTWLFDFEHQILGIPSPELTVVLSVPVEFSFEMLKKEKKDRDSHEKDYSYQKRVHSIYEAFCCWHEKDHRLINCVEDGKLLFPEEIHKKVWEVVQPILPPH